ncbi:MAG: Asp-tRNA(Asn)/Glu-tRNA(Gln) amidotransferase subunit GatA [Spirochaetaceae bacterium]
MDKNKYTPWRILCSDSAQLRTYTEKVREKDQSIGAFLEFNPEQSRPAEERQRESASPRREQHEKSPLFSIPFGVKDNIAVEGFRLSCASRALEGLPSPYSATAVEKLKKAGAWIVGKTNLDEFGMGSSTENSAFKKTLNPWDTSRTPGGSSGGSAAAVASGMVPFALGTDTGGSVRQPAAFCGIYGLKPSYGAVSRYGLVAYASSLEGIGILSSDLEINREVFYTMRGEDPMDQTTTLSEPAFEEPTSEGPAFEAPPTTVGILENMEGLSPGVEEGYQKSVKTLKELGFSVKAVTLPTLDYVIPAYYTIASAEASANLARYTGIRYGYRNEEAEEPQELVETSRDESLGAEVKLRILLGTYVLRSGFQDQYYIKAQKIRTALRMDFEKIFKSIDIMMMPVFPTQAFLFGEGGLDPFQQKMADKFTATANLAGIPALSFPTGKFEGLPVGMQFLAPMFGEERLFKAAQIYSRAYTPELPEDSLDWGRRSEDE